MHPCPFTDILMQPVPCCVNDQQACPAIEGKLCYKPLTVLTPVEAAYGHPTQTRFFQPNPTNFYGQLPPQINNVSQYQHNYDNNSANQHQPNYNYYNANPQPHYQWPINTEQQQQQNYNTNYDAQSGQNSFHVTTTPTTNDFSSSQVNDDPNSIGRVQQNVGAQHSTEPTNLHDTNEASQPTTLSTPDDHKNPSPQLSDVQTPIFPQGKDEHEQCNEAPSSSETPMETTDPQGHNNSTPTESQECLTNTITTGDANGFLQNRLQQTQANSHDNGPTSILQANQYVNTSGLPAGASGVFPHVNAPCFPFYGQRIRYPVAPVNAQLPILVQVAEYTEEDEIALIMQNPPVLHQRTVITTTDPYFFVDQLVYQKLIQIGIDTLNATHYHKRLQKLGNSCSFTATHFAYHTCNQPLIREFYNLDYTTLTQPNVMHTKYDDQWYQAIYTVFMLSKHPPLEQVTLTAKEKTFMTIMTRLCKAKIDSLAAQAKVLYLYYRYRRQVLYPTKAEDDDELLHGLLNIDRAFVRHN
ncbi:hypothetical protein M569_12996 [Genlisea aurea]|uniref:Uncharacterized protein n=1 Tax=Genlisea aurea TaxID=192259 RepID=S8DPR7_9LAMI|nr:hypothetical protein M569_12996 [Genlisea aurea]